MIRGRPAAVALLFSLCISCPAPAPQAAKPETEPFRTRNLSPLIAIFAVPAWERAPAAGLRELTLTIEAANHFWFEHGPDQYVEFDAETWRAALRYRQAFEVGWSVGVELPVQRFSGGMLDRVIDRWHRAFGLPDGARGERPTGEVLLRASDGLEPFIDIDRPVGAVGDLRITVGRNVGATRDLLLRLEAKLPTGDERRLAGSGAADLSLTLTRAYSGRFAQRAAGWYWGAGVLVNGGASWVGHVPRRTVPVAMLGGGWRFGDRLGIKAQLDMHGPYYRTALAHGRAGAQLSLGGWWQLADDMTLDFAVNEDVTVHRSPDLVVHAALRRTF